MGKPVKLVDLGNSRYCLIFTGDDWREGVALKLDTKEIIYYNGDYGDERPANIKQIAAEPGEIGWVKFHGASSIFSKFDEVLFKVIPILEIRNGNCILEDHKMGGKYVINLQE